MKALIISVVGLAVLVYIAAILWVGNRIQDYCFFHWQGRGAIGLPWIWSMFMLLILPIAIGAQLSQ
jgi:hypothetical protein